MGLLSLVADELEHPTKPTWRPMRHQVPPDFDSGDWMYWMLCGGRGIGKTDAGAYGFDLYMRTHPGHRGRIIAPTLGDAREACVVGPSGIKAHNPDVRWNVNDGTLTWPNGARARIFGAHGPDDVERLRAGGNCFDASTLIQLERGAVPITHVEPGDRAWTRDGLRRVSWTGMTGTRRLLQIETVGGLTLRVTPEHRVWTERRGHVLADRLTSHDTIWTWWNGAAASGGAEPVGTSVAAAPAYSTERSGSMLTERSLQAWRSTIAMETKATTTSAISNSSPWPSIAGSMPGDRMPLMRLGGDAGRHTRAALWSVRSAESRTGIEDSSHRDSVRRSAQTLTTSEPGQGAAMWMPPASFVAPGSSLASAPRLVRDRVLRVTPIPGVAPVFDLTVDDELHEVFANGILTHQSHTDWYEELAAWAKLDEMWPQARFGLRLGPVPKAIITTTPKPRKRIRWLLGREEKDLGPAPAVVLSAATTFDNPHLSAEVRAELEIRYRGTRDYRQELLGELVDDVQGALWNRDLLEQNRVMELPEMVRVVMGIDPAVTHGENSDETGIVVAGLGTDGDGYVFSDLSCKLAPQGWASRAVAAFHQFQVDRIVPEVNNGGEMVELTLRTIEPDLPIRAVHASRGKRVRAEPIAALYEQGRVHHYGVLGELEDQMCQFLPENTSSSPDRVDALVWALTDLMPARTMGRSEPTFGSLEVRYG